MDIGSVLQVAATMARARVGEQGAPTGVRGGLAPLAALAALLTAGCATSGSRDNVLASSVLVAATSGVAVLRASNRSTCYHGLESLMEEMIARSGSPVTHEEYTEAAQPLKEAFIARGASIDQLSAALNTLAIAIDLKGRARAKALTAAVKGFVTAASETTMTFSDTRYLPGIEMPPELHAAMQLLTQLLQSEKGAK